MYIDIAFHYTGILPPVIITGTSSTTNSITVNIGTIPDGVSRVIIGYDRLDLGQPVVGRFVNNYRGRSITFSSLVPGAKYRITAWGLGRGSDKEGADHQLWWRLLQGERVSWSNQYTVNTVHVKEFNVLQ